ncbi:TPA: pyruvate, phosphate dikinase [Candidatus Delongbacteria bacterium]|nr:MAG: pyruvate, phosphate dikinase [Candidatus Delongbacteria bacterium GWF2_40_14]HAQ60874.1 pyruvate, phosphate dikinase [Candidatus Delongbacteria bacterium]
MENKESLGRLIRDLRERAKEIKCLYQTQELLNDQTMSSESLCKEIAKILPPGFQYPDVCRAKIVFGGKSYFEQEFEETKWELVSNIIVRNEIIGQIKVFYTEERPNEDNGPFLKEEKKLLDSIADQFGMQILHKQLKSVFEEGQQKFKEKKSEWWIILDLLKRTDPRLLVNIAQKMLNYLCLSGISEAERFLDEFNPSFKKKTELFKDNNFPMSVVETYDILNKSSHVFDIASRHISEEDILDSIQKWIKEDRSGFMVNILENMSSSLSEISNAIERYHHLSSQGLELSKPRAKSFRVALTRRILTDQPGFIEIAKEHVRVDDFNNLMKTIIHPADSHGKIGGKSSGLFLAQHILKNSSADKDLSEKIKFPKSWYITSDGLLEFMNYNSLEDIVEQKYKDISQVRQEYPYVIHVFKNSTFPPDMIKGLTLALEDLGEDPLIVRSSSLLEDRLGTSFAGKYKSLFIANQGTREERLNQLTDAITEVYASTFGPDPIEYRDEHALLDYLEEMGIIIQQVVGNRIGNYFMPSFAGVAFSSNDFRWSPRLESDDGLIRIVPGLGTRAVDRISDDYTAMISPGKPELRVNSTIEEKIKYSPKKLDVINLKTGKFETIELNSLLEESGSEYPFINNIVSEVDDKHLRTPRSIGHDYTKNLHIATFEGLLTKTTIVSEVKALLDLFKEKYNSPIDIEFAHDGKNIYILQCRPQSFNEDSQPAEIPENVLKKNILFTAEKHISNGLVPDVTHLVYVDPQEYSEITSHDDLLSIGKVVGKLNKILPKRQFILMGPGRWGSRGDIKLGVSVTYSDINNTSMLIEIAKKRDQYVPELSFGTHFFQDLVEANIKYLPLYPDDNRSVFNDKFIVSSKNHLSEILPDYSHLEKIIKVIDISEATGGNNLHIYMNSQLQKASGMFSEPTGHVSLKRKRSSTEYRAVKTDIHWKWRLNYAQEIALALDPEKFGVKEFYIFGSVKNATAGPLSDIDIIIHFSGTENQKRDLINWLDGWDRCLTRVNFYNTGHKTDKILDIHFITDSDILKKTSYALKIGALTDAARPLQLKITTKEV